MRLAARVYPALHDLDAIEVCALRILRCGDQEGRRLAGGRLQFPTHRDAFRITGRDEILLEVAVGEVEAAEEPHADPRSRRRESLLALHRVPDRLARVGRRPDAHDAGSRLLPADVLVGRPAQDREFPALGTRLEGLELAEEVVFLGRREPRMRVRRAVRAVHERVGPKVARDPQARLQRLAPVLVLQGALGLGLQDQVAAIPEIPVGELVGGRQRRMRLALSLDLGDFVQRLVARPHLSPLAGHRRPVELFLLEHAAVRHVAVVRNRQHLAAGVLFVGGHPFPELGRILGLESRQRQAGQRAISAVAEDDVSVQVVAAVRVDRPFVCNERRELARLVEVLGRLDGFFPSRLHPFRVHHDGWELARGLHDDELALGGPRACFVARCERVAPARQLFLGHHLRVAGDDLVDRAHAVRVVGHHEPVVGTVQFRLLAGVGFHFLADGQAIGVLRSRDGAVHARVRRPARVDVGVAEERLARNVRVANLGDRGGCVSLAVRLAWVLRLGIRAGRQQQGGRDCRRNRR